MADESGLISGVWVLKGLGNEPAVMALVEGHLWLHTEAGAVLDADRSQVTVSFPKLQLDGGCVLEHGGERVRLSFVRPNGAASASSALLTRVGGIVSAVGAIGAVSKMADVSAGRKLGKRWKALLIP